MLPRQNLTFNIFMDSYFSNIPLFIVLRELNIGACRTARQNTTRFPKELKIYKGDKLDWNTLSAVVVDEKVFAILWMDNGPVTMMSTIHEIVGDPSFITRNRRRPRETSTNAKSVRAAFGGNPCADLLIPKIIDDYNHNMNGVDISD
ncbi:hypothetical protein BGX27_006734 [Mortierella sp. AM989]|nr:hypothetical protein BGX27_006734 [Mortierella sp. AM989]